MCTWGNLVYLSIYTTKGGCSKTEATHVVITYLVLNWY